METVFNTEGMNANKLDIVFFDCEMSGLHSRHELLEIGLVKIKAGSYEEIARENIRLRPLCIEEADPEAMKFNQYSEEGWKDALEPKQAMLKFLSYTDGCMLAGHNVQQDWAQIWKYISKYNLKGNYFYKSLDTFSIAYAKLYADPKLEKYSLTELGEYFGIKRENAHNALADAELTLRVFKELMKL